MCERDHSKKAMEAYTVCMKHLSNFVFLGLSLIWLRSGIEKILSGSFPENLSQTLMHFSENNPIPSVVNVIDSVFLPYSIVYGYLVMYGELYVGMTIGIICLVTFQKAISRSFLYLLASGFFIGAFLNVTFWITSGYLSPSGDALNLLMLYLEILGLVYVTVMLKKVVKENG